jgi:hypothetical protein
MTALTVPARPVEDTGPRPVLWRRMAWVTWRQHRTALAGVAALLGALAVGLWLIGLRLHHAYAAAAACHPAASAICYDMFSSFNTMDGFLATGVILQILPALIGAFAGAPVLAREMETGTFRYVWTQGFGRWRWALAKLVLLAVALAAAVGLFTLLTSWYYEPYFAAGNPTPQTPFSPGLFGLRGPAFAAWTLAAFAIGALAGMLTRRVVPAIAATLAAYAGLAVATGLYLRQHYLTPLLTSNPNLPGSAWVISQQWQTKSGQPVSQSVLGQVLQGAPQLAGKGGVPNSPNVTQYLIQHGYTQWTSYQPGSRFWPFQWIESGWLLALSVLLIAATVWLVRRRAA